MRPVVTAYTELQKDEMLLHFTPQVLAQLIKTQLLEILALGR